MSSNHNIEAEDASRATACPSSPPVSPSYPPLLSASLFPPPPPTYHHYTPLNLHFYSVLSQYWPSKGSQEERELHHIHQSQSTSGWTPRLKLQRTLLLSHSSTLTSLPESLLSLYPELKSDEDVRQCILSLGSLDLKLEMDSPDLEVIRSQEVAGYMAFGQWWPIPPKQTALEEAGVKRVYDQHTKDEDGRIDRRPALLLLLRTFIVTYLKLLSLLQYPPSYTSIRTLHSITANFTSSSSEAIPNPSGQVAEGEKQEEITWSTSASLHWTHLRTLVINFQEILNSARPEQAKCNLHAELQRRVDQRKRHLQRIREAIKINRQSLDRLRDMAAATGHNNPTDLVGSSIEVKQRTIAGCEKNGHRPDRSDQVRGDKRVKIRLDDDDGDGDGDGDASGDNVKQKNLGLVRVDTKDEEMEIDVD